MRQQESPKTFVQTVTEAWRTCIREVAEALGFMSLDTVQREPRSERPWMVACILSWAAFLGMATGFLISRII